jgi:hypothetical protein
MKCGRKGEREWFSQSKENGRFARVELVSNEVR